MIDISTAVETRYCGPHPGVVIGNFDSDPSLAPDEYVRVRRSEIVEVDLLRVVGQ